ncbi:unnamed protein product, partial [marine sediment metagenome]
DKALKDSFKKEKGFPSFKKKHFLNDSFTCRIKPINYYEMFKV